MFFIVVLLLAQTLFQNPPFLITRKLQVLFPHSEQEGPLVISHKNMPLRRPHRSVFSAGSSEKIHPLRGVFQTVFHDQFSFFFLSIIMPARAASIPPKPAVMWLLSPVSAITDTSSAPRTMSARGTSSSTMNSSPTAASV